MEIKTIQEMTSYTYIEKKSKFISFLFPVFNKQDIEIVLNDLKKKYMDANHICYAYILYEENEGTTYKAYDDKEPSSTAGAPILNVLKKNELCNCICVVIRYFGGIKLGAGGLSRAYSHTAANALLLANVKTYQKAFLYLLSFSYDKKREIESYLEQTSFKIIKKKYLENIEYEILSLTKEEVFVFRKKTEFLNAQIDFIKQTMAIKD